MTTNSRASSSPVLLEPKEDMKYLLVSGGVISGVGKGVITSSIGTLLKSVGLSVTAIKIDPYLNIDAGTFSPYEHGELVLNYLHVELAWVHRVRMGSCRMLSLYQVQVNLHVK